MKIKDATNKINYITNEIEYLLSIKELAELKYEDGKLLSDDAFNQTCSEINKKIDSLYEKRIELEHFINNELIKSNDYDELLKEIIYFREVSPTQYTWQEIADMVHFSEVYCRKLYSKYKKQRNV